MLRIRICMFLGLQDPDPDPLVRGADPDSVPHQNVTDPQHWFPNYIWYCTKEGKIFVPYQLFTWRDEGR